MPTTKACKSCSQSFELKDSDLAFYSKISVPPPTLCPDCRQQRRLTYRNERKFYRRKCDFSGKDIVTVYSPDKKCKVYSTEVWWQDNWDPLAYGRDFDFSKPFFEQFNDLSLETPRPCIINFNSENSLYTNHSAFNKNCYMCINTGWCEDLMYCTNYNLYNKNCVDCLAIQKCELCYYCVDSKNAYGSNYLHECVDCSSCHFCYDCRSCQDCFMCFNLRRKQYCILNKQYTKEEYERKLQELLPKTSGDFAKTFSEFLKNAEQKAIHKNVVSNHCENCTGDHLQDNKNVHDSFHTFGSQDCSYCYDCGDMKNCIDAYEPFKGELQYETHGCNDGYRLIATSKCYTDNDAYYSQYCFYCSNIFGCFGLKRKNYCILNKQYSPEEYKKMTARIIEHMKKTGEWGEFFPAKLSPFGYNETAANNYYPLEKEEALKKGFNWKDEDKRNFAPQTYKVPESIRDVPDTILNEILACKQCGKNYKLIAQELQFYKQRSLPVPALCPDCRHTERMKLRNPRRLWERNCAKCNAKVESTYAPNRPETVYCEKCYLEAVY